jgi:hypothetical protein
VVGGACRGDRPVRASVRQARLERTRPSPTGGSTRVVAPPHLRIFEAPTVWLASTVISHRQVHRPGTAPGRRLPGCAAYPF